MENFNYRPLDEVLAESRAPFELRAKERGLSYAEITRTTGIWVIKGFSLHTSQAGDYYTSPPFTLGNLDDVSLWELRLYPHGNKKNLKDWISLELYPPPQPWPIDSKKKFSCEISLLDTNESHQHTSAFDSLKFDKEFCCYEWPKFISRQVLTDKCCTLLARTKMKIVWTIEVNSPSIKKDEIKISLADQLESLYLSGNFTDVTLIVESKEIKAHKSILSSASKVFAAMLYNNMEESKTNIIKIPNVGYEVMKEFMSFLYCKRVHNMKAMAKELLGLSEQYDVRDLKILCEKSMWEEITIDNAFETLCIAELYGCTELKLNVHRYVASNLKKVIKTKGYQELSNSHGHILKNILSTLVVRAY